MSNIDELEIRVDQLVEELFRDHASLLAEQGFILVEFLLAN